jgi:hypothetical protein
MTDSRGPGRALADFFLNGVEGALHPAEKTLLDCAVEGEICVIGDNRPGEQTDENLIRSTFLRFLLLGGSRDAPVHPRGIQVRGAWIECRPIGKLDRALDLNGGELRSLFAMRNCVLNGVIDMRDATARTLNFGGSRIEGFYGERLHTRGGLFLRKDFTCGGDIRLHAARIGGDLSCRDARLTGADCTLSAQRCQIDGDVYLDGEFSSACTIDLSGAQIAGGLRCGGASFEHPGLSLIANRVEVGGDVDLGKQFSAAGPVRLVGARIRGDLSCTNAGFNGSPALDIDRSRIDGIFFWRGVAAARGPLDLEAATIGAISFDQASWELPEHIVLDDLDYRSFSGELKSGNARFWRNWLARQPEKHLKAEFKPKPYEQLAGVLSAMGYEEEARAVRIERRRQQTRFMTWHEPWPAGPGGKMMRVLSILWERIIGFLISYGYRPGNAVLYLLIIWLAGGLLYQYAAWVGVMTPTHPLIFKEAQGGGAIPEACADNWVHFPDAIAQQCADAVPSEYSGFAPFIYSADVVLPIINLRQEVDWAPRIVHPDGSPWPLGEVVRGWEWFQIVAGWMLSLLFVSAIGGVIRRE